MRIALCLASILLLAGCASGPPIDYSYTAKSQDSRAQFLILHFTAGGFNGSLKILTEGPVSSHYLVSEGDKDTPPIVYQLVDENRRAFHAGQSSWKGQTMLNAASIGIEIVNLGYRDGPNGREWFDFSKAQMDLVMELCRDIIKRHNIRPDRVIGHSDIAPGRKNDPGPKFPWKRFAEEGLILWPDAQVVARMLPVYEKKLPDVQWFQQKLAAFGYAVPNTALPGSVDVDAQTRNVIGAFQMRYRQAKFDGTPDAETAAMLDALTRPVAPAAPPVPNADLMGHHGHAH